MANFKQLILTPFVALLGCNDHNDAYFFSSMPLQEKQPFVYQDIHKLALTLSNLTKEIDESGFSPVLKCKFHLENTLHGPWPQAWVAFDISVLVSNTEITSIKRAGVLQGYSMDIEFQQNLPKFGVKPADITINITPIAWMPSYPLIILDSEPKSQ